MYARQFLLQIVFQFCCDSSRNKNSCFSEKTSLVQNHRAYENLFQLHTHFYVNQTHFHKKLLHE